MPKKRPGAKAGDPEGRPRYVAMYYAEMDSMAGKTLSYAAFWLLAQIKKAWRGDNLKIELPFLAVSWKMNFRIFNKARRELVDMGFVDIVNPGERSAGGKNPAIYALSERWRGAVSKRLADDSQAGYLKNVRQKDGSFVSTWYPAKKGKKAKANIENWKKAAAAMAKKRAAAELQKKAKRTPKIKPKRIPKSPDQELAAAKESFRRRLQNGIALTERTGHG